MYQRVQASRFLLRKIHVTSYEREKETKSFRKVKLSETDYCAKIQRFELQKQIGRKEDSDSRFCVCELR